MPNRAGAQIEGDVIQGTFSVLDQVEQDFAGSDTAIGALWIGAADKASCGSSQQIVLEPRYVPAAVPSANGHAAHILKQPVRSRIHARLR